VAERLLNEGWEVAATGRNPDRMPAELAEKGATFIEADRTSAADMPLAVGRGADLVVDCVCYTAADARLIQPHLSALGSLVVLSSKAVYVDDAGHHPNSDVKPRFPVPITETQRTMAPGDMPYDSREGYGANKVAAEQVLLGSGHPVTVLRASKVHGPWSSQPREWVFARRALDRRRPLILIDGGRGIDHTTAVDNIASLVATVAAHPGQRVLNCADPDAPSGLEIARIVADHLGHEWDEVMLTNGAPPGFPGLGSHPWDAPHPIVLDMSAASALGYQPAGDYASTVTKELDWLVDAATGGAGQAMLPPEGEPYFARFFDYQSEDRYLGGLTRSS
jgi:nucleoside-diphosphate-sugar epimerase